MRVVFLDFDGVIVVRPDLRNPNPERVALLNRIVNATGAVIVVSSTWRLYGGVERCVGALRAAGFTGEVIGRTPSLTMTAEGAVSQVSVPRGIEVAAWLTDHPVESFVVLDDDADRGPIPPERWLKCEFESGLTEKHVSAACWILQMGLSE